MSYYGRPKSVASQAPNLHERENGIAPFDCPVIAFSPFDGLARKPRRHSVLLMCVVVPGRSGGRLQSPSDGGSVAATR
jgi:hypothetical protein